MDAQSSNQAVPYIDRQELCRNQLGVPDLARFLVEQVYARLTARYPRSDPDDLLSDAGLGVALALHQSNEQMGDGALIENAYRRSIDAYRDHNPPSNRERLNPTPKDRDGPVTVIPIDPAALPDTPVPAEPPEAHVLDLLELIDDPIQRDVVTRHGLEGRSYYELQAVYDVSVQRVHSIYWSGIAQIRIALGLPVTRRMARAKQWVRKDGRTLYDPRGIAFADDSENGRPHPERFGADRRVSA